MNRPLYPLPLVTAGGGARVPVDAASQGVLLSLLGGTDPAGERLHLTRDEYQGGLVVHHGPARIGRLPQSVLETYPQLGHLLNQGLSPAPGVAVTPEPGSGRLTAELLLPAPGLVMPANSAPEEPWALLPEGTRRALDTAAGEGTGPLERVVPAQFLAVLRVLDGTVVAAVDDHVVGPLSAADSAAVRDLVDHYSALGLVPVARLYIYDAAPGDVGGRSDGPIADVAPGSHSVVVDVRDAASATEADLEPQVNPLPEVSAYRPATGSFPVVGAEAKEWTVTVAGATVTDELPAMTPERLARLREVAPPTMPGQAVSVQTAQAGQAGQTGQTGQAAPVAEGSAAGAPAPERAAAMGFPLITPEQVAADRRSNPAVPAREAGPGAAPAPAHAAEPAPAHAAEPAPVHAAQPDFADDPAPAHTPARKRPAMWPGLLAMLIGIALVAGGGILGFATTEAVVVAVIGAVLILLGVAALVRRGRFKMDRR
ncbi:hypothetical protein [Corynebacterium frankenforstense]|uniref:hypothetical protein n=1 Tax=Corynebacterium frankenforstense TaxID=1230998 RepID=UPI0026ECFD34|nr:hypothetical protein [Corynebacterium frankenforstense]